MYDDNRPCAVCGAEVELRARTDRPTEEPGKVGPREGYVGDGDSTVDLRVCTDPECPTNRTDDTAPSP
ncbi:hypothetical protein JK386_16870 [Nocardioides sp. zg-536]|uniref:Uncharacterized protein n=1 Tax=Nocardioides faecalis TaxID=2803858 RepID=A0A939BWZ2_9ACTN|nr:hypothetical protein [Nocardioides faecalis]MBM9461576.1 hypothetical protein [Nocardioides faecalis]QVI57790.1 hypothetical protein KG111_12035 [Nocardioides faecalis]